MAKTMETLICFLWQLIVSKNCHLCLRLQKGKDPDWTGRGPCQRKRGDSKFTEVKTGSWSFLGAGGLHADNCGFSLILCKWEP